MKRTFCFLVALLTVVFFMDSCKKDNNSNESRIRITKVADNIAMEYPWFVFEYNEENLLTDISSEGDYSSYNTVIEYNTDKKPITLTTTSYYNGTIEDESVQYIQWTNNGFEITNDYNSAKEIYELDAQNRVIKQTEIYTPQFSDPDTTIIIVNWSGEENLTVPEYSSSYKLIKSNNPFSGINLAIIFAAELDYGEWENNFQNKYCISEWGEPGLSALITYQLNAQNYPTVADVKYTSVEGVIHDYIYFEYESY